MFHFEYWSPFLLTAIPGVLAFLTSLFNRKRLQQIHISLNGKLEQFIITAKQASYEEGVKDEKLRAGELMKAHSAGIIKGIDIIDNQIIRDIQDIKDNLDNKQTKETKYTKETKETKEFD